jgi:hypothetical protein
VNATSRRQEQTARMEYPDHSPRQAVITLRVVAVDGLDGVPVQALEVQFLGSHYTVGMSGIDILPCLELTKTDDAGGC